MYDSKILKICFLIDYLYINMKMIIMFVILALVVHINSKRALFYKDLKACSKSSTLVCAASDKVCQEDKNNYFSCLLGNKFCKQCS